MIKIIDSKNRRILCEGKSYQIGFAFLKKIKPGLYETVHPISPCKDYLNDVVYSERTGKPCVAYGLRYEKQDIFTNLSAYLAFKICDHFGGGRYEGQDKDEKNLEDNYLNLQKFLNIMEDKIGITHSIIRKTETPGLFIIKVPMFWAKSTPLISLYSFLIRIGQYFDPKKEAMEFFETFNLNEDSYYIVSIKEKLKKLIEIKNPPDQDFDFLQGNEYVHAMGIVNYKMWS